MTIDSYRVDGRVLQSPVLTYRHPDSGRTVNLIGTCPIGTGDYYRRLAKLITSRTDAGAIVHSARPLLHHLDQLWDEHVDNQEVDIVDLLTAEQQAEHAGTRQLSWCRQDTALPVRAHWKLHDLNVLQIIRLIGATRMQTTLQRHHAQFGLDHEAPTMLAAVNVYQRVLVLPRLPPQRPGDLLVDTRTDTAVAAIAATGHDVVQLWNARYTPLLDAGLRDRLGFTLTSARWEPVLTYEVMTERIGVALADALSGVTFASDSTTGHVTSIASSQR